MSEQLTENFWRSEFACKCGCGLDDIDPALVDILQDVRDFFERPVLVTSGCRCLDHNEASGGAINSWHLQSADTGYCHAADIVVAEVPAHVVQDLLDEWAVPGLGSYEDFTHVDTREGFARWEG